MPTSRHPTNKLLTTWRSRNTIRKISCLLVHFVGIIKYKHMKIQQNIKLKVQEYLNEIIFLRRYFHKNPELSTQETNTSNFIFQKLQEFGLKNIKRYANNGISCVIDGFKKGRTIGIRAEMDALPIEEENNVSYRSTNKGVMHACGHDAHIAIVLGIAKILNDMKSQMQGSVKLIFQPSEETLPGGALSMIKEGVLKNPDIALMLGLHVLPELDTGKIGIKAGQYMASCDEIFIKIKGRGGHAAMPEVINDPVLCASQIIVTLKQVISENIPSGIPAILSFGKFIANGRTNIIPDKVEIEGTFRTFDEEIRKEAHNTITNIIKNIASAYGTNVEINIIHGYPSLINDNDISNRVKRALKQFLGNENIIELPLRMTSDDFSWYSQNVPACFFRLGVGFGDKENRKLHTSTFDINEKSIEIGTNSILVCVFDFLS